MLLLLLFLTVSHKLSLKWTALIKPDGETDFFRKFQRTENYGLSDGELIAPYILCFETVKYYIWRFQTFLKKIKNFRKKVLTRVGWCGILTKLSPRGTTKTRDNVPWKLNNVRKQLMQISTKKGNLKRVKWLWKFFWELESFNRFNHGKPCLNTIYWEFDPGSGWTLAACLTHASRTKHFGWRFVKIRFDLVADGWVMCEQPAFQRGTTVGNDC